MLLSKIQKSSPTVSVEEDYTFDATNKYVPKTDILDAAGINAVKTYTYDPVGNLTQVLGPRSDVTNETTNYLWTINRWKTAEFGAALASGLHPATSWGYDHDGNVTQVYRASGHNVDGSDLVVLQTTNIIYDALERKIRVDGQDGATSSVINETQYSYDAASRPLCTAVRMNPQAFGLADACAHTATGANGPDRITRYGYDAAGQLLTETRGYGGSNQQIYAAYSYSNNGKRTTLLDARQNLTTYVYDGFDRLSQLKFPNPTTTNASSATDYEAYGYDADSNLVSKQLRNSPTPGSAPVITYCYDALNRQIKKLFSTNSCAVTTGGTAGGSTDVFYAYDLLGDELYAHYLSATGSGVDYTYDKAGRMLTETAAGQTLTYHNNQDGARDTITWPSAAFGYYSLYYTKDANGHTTQVTLNGSAGASATYTWNELGQVVSIARAGGVNTFPYFDSVSRLSGLTHDFPGTANDLSLAFSYNAANQILQRAETNATNEYTYTPDGGYVSNTYDGDNRDAAIVAITGYDARGNLINEGAGKRQFTYDLENRLLTVSGSSSLTLTYDPTGRLATTTSGGAVTQFLFSGDDLVGELNGSGAELRLYNPTGLGGDQPLAWYDAPSGEYGFLIPDNQGSIIAASSSSGGVDGIYRYGPYGEPLSWTGPRYGYTGQLKLPEAKLYYYKARIYDPVTGRFLQNDPVGYDGGLNLYGYASGDPVNGSDPSGDADVEPVIVHGQMPGAQINGEGRTMNDELENALDMHTPGVEQLALNATVKPCASGKPSSKSPETKSGMEKALGATDTMSGAGNDTATAAAKIASKPIGEAAGKAFLPTTVVLVGSEEVADGVNDVKHNGLSVEDSVAKHGVTAVGKIGGTTFGFDLGFGLGELALPSGGGLIGGPTLAYVFGELFGGAAKEVGSVPSKVPASPPKSSSATTPATCAASA